MVAERSTDSLYNTAMMVWLRLWLVLTFWLGGLIQPANPNGFITWFHPSGKLRAGDLVSIEIVSPPGKDVDRQEITVSLVDDGDRIGQATFSRFRDNRYRAILQWEWNTRGLAPGAYRLRFTIPDRGVEWQQTVWLAEPEANNQRWAVRETECCRVFYITGTAAERDIDQLVGLIDLQAAHAARSLNARWDDKLEINLVPRVLGQGGFSSDQVYISYSDQNYANGNPAHLIRHELIHQVDALIPSQLRPSLFIEGVAVYLSNGHYKPEALMLRAAALMSMERLLPLAYLADHFYPTQHETGYIQAGALVEFIVQQWGWDRFQQFYRDIPEHESGSQAAAIDAASRRHFGLGLQALEDRFVALLETLPVIVDVRQDVEMTIRLYDSIRAYQQALDPAAYFEQVWLPDASQMREREITADYARTPEEEKNRMVEALLLRAGRRLRAGNTAAAAADLSLVARALAEEERQPQMIGISNGAAGLKTAAPSE